MATDAADVFHQAHAGQLKIGFPGFPVSEAALEGVELIEVIAVDAIPARLFNAPAAFLNRAACP